MAWHCNVGREQVAAALEELREEVLREEQGTVELSADAATAEAVPAEAAPAEEAAPASADAGQVPDDAPYYGDAPDHEIALDVVAWHCNVGRDKVAATLEKLREEELQEQELREYETALDVVAEHCNVGRDQVA